MPTVHKIHSVKATPTSGVYSVDVTITTLDGDTIRDAFISRPDDPYGVGPAVRQWLSENPDFPIGAYVPPDVDTIRASMPSLSARQFRLGLLAEGVRSSQVTALIEAMPEGSAKGVAQIEWEYATTFVRTQPLVAEIGAGLGLSDERIDSMWTAAVDL
ncbi:MAG TPA: hypothetical protein VGO04_23575 [Ensifer sp.]|jgi:hypothetical protein|uniref:hypothetical protein n=1 Tax=Ensifer sp. TaxID=1872086 RepID=UPI002E0FFFA9|nr:hypothetical protein [Ensifer sp.]